MSRPAALVVALILGACDVATTGGLGFETSIYDCRSSRSTTAYSFDPATTKPLLWLGTSGTRLEFTDLDTGEEIILNSDDGWTCEPRTVKMATSPDRDEEAADARHNQQKSSKEEAP